MADFDYKIIKKLGTLSDSFGHTKEVNIVQWGLNQPMLDIRKWDRNEDKMLKGISLNDEETKKLKKILLDDKEEN